MKKAVFLLGILIIVLGGCGNDNLKKHSFDYKVLPAKWTALSAEPPYYICDDAEKLTIEGDELLYINRTNDIEKYRILSSYQIADTIVIQTKIVMSDTDWDNDFKIIWMDKDKKIALWMFNSPMTGKAGCVNWQFVSDENLSEFPNIKCSERNY